MLRADLPGHLDRFEPFRAWQAGRNGRHGYGFIAQHILGHFEHQAAVGTPGKSHQHTAHAGQDIFELLILFIGHFNFSAFGITSNDANTINPFCRQRLYYKNRFLSLNSYWC